MAEGGQEKQESELCGYCDKKTRHEKMHLCGVCSLSICDNCSLECESCGGLPCITTCCAICIDCNKCICYGEFCIENIRKCGTCAENLCMLCARSDGRMVFCRECFRNQEEDQEELQQEIQQGEIVRNLRGRNIYANQNPQSDSETDSDED